MTSCHDPVDEILENVWILGEKGIDATRETIGSADRNRKVDVTVLDAVVENGLLEETGGIYGFSESGRERAAGIIRRHRLAERLLVDVLNMRDASIEPDVCCLEHVLSPEVTDHICTLLGHPRECPHGSPIPPGDCCTRAQRRVESAVVPLTELRAGDRGRILYISTKHHDRLDRLISLGLFPGRIVKVHQSEPLFVVFADETQLALEKPVAGEIFVLKS